MNIWTLNIKSSILENEYGKKEQSNGFKMLKMSTCAQIIILQYASSTHSKIYVYHLLELITGLACYIVCFLRIQTFNYSVATSLIIYISLMVWSNQDDILIEYFQTESGLPPTQQSFIYAINFIILLIGSNFLLKFFVILVLFTLLIVFVFDNPILDAVQIVSVFITLIYKIYSEDKQKRIAFLDHKQGLIRDYLVDNLLPSSLIICKYNQKYGEFQLYSQNKRSKLQFGLQDTQEFHDFCDKMVLHNNINANEVKQSLKKCKKPQWQNTLSGQIQLKMEKEIKHFQMENSKLNIPNKDSEQQQGTKIKNQSSNNIFQDLSNAQNNDIANSKNEKDAPSLRKIKMSSQKLFNNNSASKTENKHKYKKQNSFNVLQRRITQISGAGLEKSQGQSHNQNVSTDLHRNTLERENNNNNNNNLKHGVFSQNIEQFFEDIQEESEDVESFQAQMVDEWYVPIQHKKFSVKIVSFYLTDYFIAISIQKDVYREKYQQSVEENKRTNKILDQQFLNLNYLSVNSYKVIKSILQMAYQKQPNLNSSNQKIGFEEESKMMNSLLYSAYAIKQNIYNIFEWLNRKKSVYKQSVQKINILEELYGMKRIFQKQLEQQQKSIEIKISDSLQKKPLLTDERVLNQIFYNLINYCILSCPSQSSIIIEAQESKNVANQLFFSISFKPIQYINLSLLNYAELYDDNEEHYQQIIDIKICKHLLRLINPQNKISFRLTKEEFIEIYFHLNLQEFQDGTDDSLVDSKIRNILENSATITNQSIIRQNIMGTSSPKIQQQAPPSPFGQMLLSGKKNKQKPYQEVISEQANSSSYQSNENESKNSKDFSLNKSIDPKFLDSEKTNKMSQFWNYQPKQGDFSTSQDTFQDKKVPQFLHNNLDIHSAIEAANFPVNQKKQIYENEVKSLNNQNAIKKLQLEGMEVLDLQNDSQQLKQNKLKQVNDLNKKKQITSAKLIDCSSVDIFQEESDKFQNKEIFQLPKGLSHIQNQNHTNDPAIISQNQFNTFLKNSDSKALFFSYVHQSQDEQTKTGSIMPHISEQQNYQNQKILQNSIIGLENHSDNSMVESNQIQSLGYESNKNNQLESNSDDNYSTFGKQIDQSLKNI